MPTTPGDESFDDLLAQITSRTAALKNPSADEARGEAEQRLLADLAAAVALLRADTTTLGASLTRVLSEASSLLDALGPDAKPQVPSSE